MSDSGDVCRNALIRSLASSLGLDGNAGPLDVLDAIDKLRADLEATQGYHDDALQAIRRIGHELGIDDQGHGITAEDILKRLQGHANGDSLVREELGRLVRKEWIRWAKEQAEPEESWLTPWEELAESEREADRRIGEAVRRALAPPAWIRGDVDPVALVEQSIGDEVMLAVAQKCASAAGQRIERGNGGWRWRDDGANFISPVDAAADAIAHALSSKAPGAADAQTREQLGKVARTGWIQAVAEAARKESGGSYSFRSWEQLTQGERDEYSASAEAVRQAVLASSWLRCVATCGIDKPASVVAVARECARAVGDTVFLAADNERWRCGNEVETFGTPVEAAVHAIESALASAMVDSACDVMTAASKAHDDIAQGIIKAADKERAGIAAALGMVDRAPYSAGEIVEQIEAVQGALGRLSNEVIRLQEELDERKSRQDAVADDAAEWAQRIVRERDGWRRLAHARRLQLCGLRRELTARAAMFRLTGANADLEIKGETK